MELGTEGWLERIAAAAHSSDTLALAYDDWAPHYDADMLATGYPNIAVSAALIARYVPVDGTEILDAGAGTGMLGAVLHAVGYRNLTGIDISAGMLERARERTVYRELFTRTLGEPLGFDDRRFTAVSAVGVFAFGHAPATALDELVRVTRPGGVLIFNVNEGPWERAGFKDKVEALEASGRWELVEVAGPYRPMPLSPTRGTVTTRAFVFRVRDR